MLPTKMHTTVTIHGFATPHVVTMHILGMPQVPLRSLVAHLTVHAVHANYQMAIPVTHANRLEAHIHRHAVPHKSENEGKRSLRV